MPAVVEVMASAAGNGDRSENADYQYGKRRLPQIDGRIPFLTKRIEAAEVAAPKPQKQKPPGRAARLTKVSTYRVDSISKPQASSKGSGMYLEFLLRRAHSRSRVERRY